METTKQIVDDNNKNLTNLLIPKGTEPIIGNFIIDPNDEIFNQKIQKI